MRNYDTLVDDIASRAGIGNLASAERAAIETLLTLGECIDERDADALGVVLPGALGDAITERADAQASPSAEEFVTLVADRQGFGVDERDAVAHVRAVMATIASHGGYDELTRVRRELPEEFDPLFATVDLDASGSD